MFAAPAGSSDRPHRRSWRPRVRPRQDRNEAQRRRGEPLPSSGDPPRTARGCGSTRGRSSRSKLVATMGRTIVVRLDQNRLYSLRRVRRDPLPPRMATAKPGFTTPSGVWNIYDKAENPTWSQPGFGLLGRAAWAMIPGGPGNPDRGARAIYIDALGLIRIHGTTDDSRSGATPRTGASGCTNSEIELAFHPDRYRGTCDRRGSRPAERRVLERAPAPPPDI